jgi:hypothetical protein
MYSVQFFFLHLVDERLVLKSVCLPFFFWYHWLLSIHAANNPEEQIHKLRSGGSLDITRYPIPPKNHRNTCCKGYRVPAP